MHLHGGSSGVEDMSERRLPRYYYASRARYFTIHHGRVGLWAANLLWVLGRVVSLGARARRLEVAAPSQGAVSGHSGIGAWRSVSNGGRTS